MKFKKNPYQFELKIRNHIGMFETKRNTCIGICIMVSVELWIIKNVSGSLQKAEFLTP
jgi:hypothetical protein